jgi:DNA-binding CsgD family transcriptional regulator
MQLLEERNENSLLDSIQPAAEAQEPWLLIPDSGNNRQIVRLWNEHRTCKEISGRVGGTEKTILNRINLLRKQFGPQIVPYRKALLDKKQEVGDK